MFSDQGQNEMPDWLKETDAPKKQEGIKFSADIPDWLINPPAAEDIAKAEETKKKIRETGTYIATFDQAYNQAMENIRQKRIPQEQAREAINEMWGENMEKNFNLLSWAVDRVVGKQIAGIDEFKQLSLEEQTRALGEYYKVLKDGSNPQSAESIMRVMQKLAETEGETEPRVIQKGNVTEAMIRKSRPVM